jgi:hypothetical protein
LTAELTEYFERRFHQSSRTEPRPPDHADLALDGLVRQRQVDDSLVPVAAGRHFRNQRHALTQRDQFLHGE